MKLSVNVMLNVKHFETLDEQYEDRSFALTVAEDEELGDVVERITKQAGRFLTKPIIRATVKQIQITIAY